MRRRALQSIQRLHLLGRTITARPQSVAMCPPSAGAIHECEPRALQRHWQQVDGLDARSDRKSLVLAGRGDRTCMLPAPKNPSCVSRLQRVGSRRCDSVPIPRPRDTVAHCLTPQANGANGKSNLGIRCIDIPGQPDAVNFAGQSCATVGDNNAHMYPHRIFGGVQGFWRLRCSSTTRWRR